MDASAITGTKNQQKRRVMVVADPTRESAAALQYTLSHVVEEKDELVLIHVASTNQRRNTLSHLFKRQQQTPLADPSVIDTAPTSAATGASSSAFLWWLSLGEGSHGGGGWVGGARDGEFLEFMRKACEDAHPEMKVFVEKVEQGSMDKAGAIMFKTKALSIDILIIGQRRSLSAVILGQRLSGSTKGLRTVDAAEYLIEHCPCTCVGVQKKGQNDGYLLNTKTHRNFWLLA